MLVKFAIDPAIVTEEDYPPIVHERLQRLWVKDRLGVLVDTLWEGQLNTYEAFKSIENKDIRDKWLVMYRKAREVGLLQAVPAKRRISGGDDNDDIETLANHINVLITRADIGPMVNGQVLLREDGRKVIQFASNGNRQIELIGLDDFDFCGKFEQVKEIRNRGIVPKGSSVAKVWEERFKDEYQSKGSRNIHVMDRFCLEEGKNGLDRFIGLAKSTLPPSKRGKILHVYVAASQNTDHTDQNEAFKKVQNWLRGHKASPSPFLEAKVHILKRRDFGKITPDRWIRFGDLMVLGGGHGTEIFESVGVNQVTHRANQTTVHTDIEGCAEVERKLSEAAMESRIVDSVMIS